ncbi:MAG: Gfo/Idh/MocA family oxidoreductase, partial [Vicingaceae bacterium]
MDKVRFAIVGCGHIGKRHAEMVRGNPEAELVGMADIRPANELGIDNFKVPFFHTIESLLSSGLPIDVINICTPNGLHESQSIMALEGGFHVVCEKPMALTKEGAEHIIFKALQVHKHVFAVMQNRYSPPSVWLKELVDQKRLGDLYMVEIKCYWNRDERYYKEDGWKGSADMDGGTLFTQFSHFVDIMFWLFGDIKNIQAKFNDFNHAHNTDFEDSGFVMFDFVKGGMGSLNYSTAIWDKNLESSITI